MVGTYSVTLPLPLCPTDELRHGKVVDEADVNGDEDDGVRKKMTFLDLVLGQQQDVLSDEETLSEVSDFSGGYNVGHRLHTRVSRCRVATVRSHNSGTVQVH